ncbi:type II toxin-antitoxin system RelE/ParE family toxin [Sulfurospirillum cavolei]|uniref:type II toxin-antitoxin system RelE/ParE family toxin n=1 Tax=Sulfurospirillum cavolei TaxID=366522 RepID=UPI0005A8F4AA|nr:type II toxin-antitoxin system mRNA interferase toxin, RelE/StbE family [Sulfurospirillum cavolei]
MPYNITRTDEYFKKSLKFFKKHPEMLSKYEKTLILLSANPHHPSLRLHKLQGNLKEFYSVSLDLKYRIILDFIIVDEVIILLDIGSHDEVY